MTTLPPLPEPALEAADVYWRASDMRAYGAACAAAELERCAKLCEGRIGGAVKNDEWWGGFKEAMRQCAAAIRALRD